VAGASGSKLGVRLVRGTEGSNPSPSSGESAANLTSSPSTATPAEGGWDLNGPRQSELFENTVENLMFVKGERCAAP
jgi:hypothetical protein